MKKIYFIGAFLVTTMSFGQATNVGLTGNVDGVYINEFHYDNQSTDVGEFVEVAGPAGTDLSVYKIVLYNGNVPAAATAYHTITLTGVIDNEGSGVGAVNFAIPATPGLQNGANDGIALIKTGNNNVQLLSYEGTLTVVGTDTNIPNLASYDIGVAEVPPTGTGTALVGASLEYDEASQTWISISDDTPDTFTQGTLNISQNNISGLKVYPNPAKNTLYVTSDSFEVKEVQLYDVLGKSVLNTKTANNTVNISSLSKGVYVVKITEGGKTATRKIVIE